MNKYVVDTNALISFLTDRSPDQRDVVKSVLESVSRPGFLFQRFGAG